MNNITLNNDQDLYVFHHAEYITCRGFESLFNETVKLAKKLSPELTPSKDEFGEISVVDKHDKLIKMAGEKNLGTWFSSKTPQKLQRVLSAAIRNQSLVKISLGDRETGKDWLEENDVVGRIGRSTGVLKVPLLVEDGEHGGCALLDDCVVRVMDVETGEELYRQANYNLPAFTIDHEAVDVTVKADGETHAKFSNAEEAYLWIGFVSGTSMRRH